MTINQDNPYAPKTPPEPTPPPEIPPDAVAGDRQGGAVLAQSSQESTTNLAANLGAGRVPNIGDPVVFWQSNIPYHAVVVFISNPNDPNTTLDLTIQGYAHPAPWTSAERIARREGTGNGWDFPHDGDFDKDPAKTEKWEGDVDADGKPLHAEPLLGTPPEELPVSEPVYEPPKDETNPSDTSFVRGETTPTDESPTGKKSKKS